MIMKDAVTSFLITLSKFCAKKGTDPSATQELISAINTITDTNTLLMVYVNDQDNIKVPDVYVTYMYGENISQYLLDTESTVMSPFGYTIEINSRCFKKYTEEELGAVILHDILQNAMSDTAKIRLVKAYTAVLNKYQNEAILKLFHTVSLDEVLYIAYTEICMRPFKMPIDDMEYVATDDVLKVMGLADAYNSYLKKSQPMSNVKYEDQMAREMQDDERDLNTIITACFGKDLQHYYRLIRENVPLLTFKMIMKEEREHIIIGITHQPGAKLARIMPNSKVYLSESFNDPKTDYDIRFQIDKIIGNIRYAESEAEREVILYKIKTLSIKLTKTEVQLSKVQNPPPSILERKAKIAAYKKELDDLRQKVVNMEIKEKRWHVYSKLDMPAGYDF